MQLITAYKVKHTNPITGEVTVAGNWYGDEAHDTIDEAVARMEELAKCYPVAAVFYRAAWLNSGNPKYLIDKTDKGDAPIRGLEGLVNSLPPDHF